MLKKEMMRNGMKEINFFDEEGRLHREDGPAVTIENGIKMWFIHGVLHREDGPAIEAIHLDDGYNAWYLNGKVSRNEAEGPALEYKNGRKMYCKDNMLHRENGPALIDPKEGEKYFLEDSEITRCTFLKISNFQKE